MTRTHTPQNPEPVHGSDDSQRRVAFRLGLSESRAAPFLIAKGYRILARRFRTSLGEIDMVARRRGRARVRRGEGARQFRCRCRSDRQMAAVPYHLGNAAMACRPSRRCDGRHAFRSGRSWARAAPPAGDVRRVHLGHLSARTPCPMSSPCPDLIRGLLRANYRQNKFSQADGNAGQARV